MNFALNYLVGLESVKLKIAGTDNNWIEKQHEAFCNTVLKLLLSTKRESHVFFEAMDVGVLQTCIDSIVETVFINNPAKSVLTVYIGVPAEYKGLGLMNFDASKTQEKRELKLWEEQLPSSIVKSTSCLSLVQVFKLEIVALKQYPDVINISTYITLLQGMTALQELVLDLPTAYDDFSDTSSFETIYTHVESLTLQTTPRASYQALLDQFCTTFPSLKYLKLFYSCGIWDDDADKFQINLKEYTLDKLVVDATALKAKQEKSMQQFFVIDMGGEHIYKVPFNISSFTKIKNDDLKNFTSGKDYLTIEISIRSLERLELLMYCDFDEEEYKQLIDRYDDEEHDLYLKFDHMITRLTIPILHK